MEIYNNRACRWCWEYWIDDGGDGDGIVPRILPAAWTVTFKKDGELRQENICNDCRDDIYPNLLIDCDYTEGEDVTIEPFTDPPILVFQRGDRVNVERTNRPPLTGTVVHCYLSLRTYASMVNVVVDGKKWPTVYPAHIVSKRVLTAKGIAA